MKKTGIIHRMVCIVLVVLLAAVPVCANNESEYELPVTSGCHTIDAQVPMLKASKDITNLYSAFLYDYNTQTLVYSVNPDEEHDPASLVKIMTCLILSEQANMDDKVTVSDDLLDTLPEYSFGVELEDGEIISMQDLLYCIMVESANDAAVVAAAHLYGSLDAFVDEMNRYATELGCTNTNFTNVHGLYDPQQHTSARDLAKILTKAVTNETFMDVFSTVRYTIPKTNKHDIRELSCNNFLMNDDIMTIYLDYRVTGGRAAIMETGERNLAVTAEQDGVELISVVMGSASVIADDGYSVVTYGSFTETSALLSLGFQGHYTCQIFHDNQVLTQFEISNGDSYLATGIHESVSALLPSGVTYSDLSYRYNDADIDIQAPIKAGDWITTVQVWYGDLCLAVADLYAMHDVKVKEYVEVEEEVIEPETGTPTGLIVIIAIVGLLIILLFGRTFIFRIIRKQRIRRSKKNNRRKH